MLGQSLMAGFGMLGPQIAAHLANKKGPTVQQADDPPAPPGADEEAVCNEAGILQRAISRIGDLEGFRNKFSDAAWEFWEAAMGATSQQKFDDAVRGLLLHLEKLTPMDAMEEVSQWMKHLPKDVQITMQPVFAGVAQRLKWPIGNDAEETAIPQE